MAIREPASLARPFASRARVAVGAHAARIRGDDGIAVLEEMRPYTVGTAAGGVAHTGQIEPNDADVRAKPLLANQVPFFVAAERGRVGRGLAPPPAHADVPVPAVGAASVGDTDGRGAGIRRSAPGTSVAPARPRPGAFIGRGAALPPGATAPPPEQAVSAAGRSTARPRRRLERTGQLPSATFCNARRPFISVPRRSARRGRPRARCCRPSCCRSRCPSARRI